MLDFTRAYLNVPENHKANSTFRYIKFPLHRILKKIQRFWSHPFVLVESIICTYRWIVEYDQIEQLQCPGLPSWEPPELLFTDHTLFQKVCPVSARTTWILFLMRSRGARLYSLVAGRLPEVWSRFKQVQINISSTASIESSPKLKMS